MELADYLRMAMRHLVVLIAVPVLAGVLAVTYVLTTPRPYTVTVHVPAPSLDDNPVSIYQYADGSGRFVTDFRVVATSPGIASAVARQEGVRADDVTGGVDVSQADRGSGARLTFATSDPTRAGTVAVAVARRALNSLLTSKVHRAKSDVRAATTSLDEANQELADFWRRHSNVPVLDRYASLKAQITKLQHERSRDLNRADEGSARAATKKIGSLQKQATKLTPIVADHHYLAARQHAAKGKLAYTHQVLSRTKAQLAAADPDQVTQASPVEMVPLGRLLARIVLPSLAVALLLEVALAALLELIVRLRVARARRTRLMTD